MSVVNQFRRLLPTTIVRSRLKLANSNSSNFPVRSQLLGPSVSLIHPISRHCAAYEGSGKTTISFLVSELRVQAYYNSGFMYTSSMSVFPHKYVVNIHKHIWTYL